MVQNEKIYSILSPFGDLQHSNNLKIFLLFYFLFQKNQERKIHIVPYLCGIVKLYKSFYYYILLNFSMLFLIYLLDNRNDNQPLRVLLRTKAEVSQSVHYLYYEWHFLYQEYLSKNSRNNLHIFCFKQYLSSFYTIYHIIIIFTLIAALLM